MTRFGFATIVGWLLLGAAAFAQPGSVDIPQLPEPPAALSHELDESFAARIARPDSVDPSLPNVLLIGDSVSICYTESVRRLLEGKANVFRIPDNARSTSYSLTRIEAWLGDRRWDTIVFNWGTWDSIQISLKEYKTNLGQLIDWLQGTEASLYFVGSLPSPPVLRGYGGDRAEFEARLARFNAAAQEVMDSKGIPAIDLVSTALPHLELHDRLNDYHLTKAGFLALGQRIVDVITNPESLSPKDGQLGLSHYIILFSCQSGDINITSKSHTSAVFVRANESRQIIEQFTISWMPATGIIEATKTYPQQGQNMNLLDTMDWCDRQGARISAWGPYLIEPILYTRARARAKYLESGRPRYLILDKNWRRRSENEAFHCIHALSDIGGYLATHDLRGEAATEAVVKHFQPWISQKERDNNWLFTSLGLRKYNIIRRK